MMDKTIFAKRYCLHKENILSNSILKIVIRLLKFVSFKELKQACAWSIEIGLALNIMDNFVKS